MGIEIQTPHKVKAILRKACYDCHSMETEVPWYGRVAPVSWLLAREVNEGRTRLNFSDWESSSRASRAFRISMSHLRAKGGSPGVYPMPPPVYRWFHPHSQLTSEELETLRDWSEQSGRHLDDVGRRLRLERPDRTSEGPLPYAVVAESTRSDDQSRIQGPRATLAVAIDVSEWDPRNFGWEAHPSGRTWTGFGSAQQWVGELRLDQGLLYVEGAFQGSVSGRGVLVVEKNAHLDLRENPELLVISSGQATLSGVGRVAIVARDLVLQDAEITGAVMARDLRLHRSSVVYDPEMTHGEFPLGDLRRAVFHFCDKDGELGERDRRLEVLADTQRIILFDPEYQTVEIATGAEEAVARLPHLLSLEPILDLKVWNRRFRAGWEHHIRELLGPGGQRAVLRYHLADWLRS